MNPQSVQRPLFDAAVPPHVHFDGEACPACGQDIPADRLEEISGKIAVREREQTLAITSQLESQHAVERAQADAKAKAELESERQRSAAREAQAREEAQKAAQTLIDEKLAEAERNRQELVSGWQQQIAAADTARESAEQAGANLQSEMTALRQASATAIEALRSEAVAREVEIRKEATRAAELGVVERITAIEAAHRASESGLQERVEQAEANRIAAEQKGAALTSQLETLEKTKDAEVAKLKEDAAAEILRVRQITTEEAETRFRDALKSNENAVAEANAKLREADGKVVALTEQHASAMEQNLNAQREILEKAKEDAVNVEKAKAFEENQKLSGKVSDLQRALEKKTAEELGEGAEIDVFEALKAEFPDDRINRIAKGAPGADICHVVMSRGKECGTILYDSKNHNAFRNEHVTKLKSDQLAANAEHAILSTHKFPQGTRQLHIQDGVLLANPARVVSVTTMVRQHLLQVHTLRLSGVERERKTAALYEFITSEHCALLLGRIEERASELQEQQAKEIRWHQNHWQKEGEAIRAIQKAKVDLENKIGLIIGTSADDNVMSEAS